MDSVAATRGKGDGVSPCKLLLKPLSIRCDLNSVTPQHLPPLDSSALKLSNPISLWFHLYVLLEYLATPLGGYLTNIYCHFSRTRTGSKHSKFESDGHHTVGYAARLWLVVPEVGYVAFKATRQTLRLFRRVVSDPLGSMYGCMNLGEASKVVVTSRGRESRTVRLLLGIFVRSCEGRSCECEYKYK